MKKKAICFFVLFCLPMAFISMFGQNNYSSNLRIGVPIHSDINWEGLNISADLDVNKRLYPKISIGVGTSFHRLDLNPSSSTLTFDRKVLDVFTVGRYHLRLLNKVKFVPGLRIGYAFVNYSLNEFNSSSKKTNGLSLTPETIITYDLTDKLYINSGLYFNTIMGKMDVDEELIIPQSYYYGESNLIFNPGFKIGVSYLFN